MRLQGETGLKKKKPMDPAEGRKALSAVRFLRWQMCPGPNGAVCFDGMTVHGKTEPMERKRGSA
jgi:hypothetical protein